MGTGSASSGSAELEVELSAMSDSADEGVGSSRFELTPIGSDREGIAIMSSS